MSATFQPPANLGVFDGERLTSAGGVPAADEYHSLHDVLSALAVLTFCIFVGLVCIGVAP